MSVFMKMTKRQEMISRIIKAGDELSNRLFRIDNDANGDAQSEWSIAKTEFMNYDELIDSQHMQNRS